MKIQAKIDRVLQSGKLKAIASVSLDGMFVVKGLKVMDGKKGLFVSMPQEVFAGNNGKKQYSNLFFPVTNVAKEELQTAVLEVYRQHLDPNYRPQETQIRSDNFYPEHERFMLEQFQQPYYCYYDKEQIPVKFENGMQIKGMVYIMDKTKDFGFPSVGYYHTVLQGYRDCGLDTNVLEEALKESMQLAREQTRRAQEALSVQDAQELGEIQEIQEPAEPQEQMRFV